MLRLNATKNWGSINTFNIQIQPMLRLNIERTKRFRGVIRIQIQPMLRLNWTPTDAPSLFAKDSNTTNVKVKHSHFLLTVSNMRHSNTTNVKVKQA